MAKAGILHFSCKMKPDCDLIAHKKNIFSNIIVIEEFISSHKIYFKIPYQIKRLYSELLKFPYRHILWPINDSAALHLTFSYRKLQKGVPRIEKVGV